MTSKKNEQLEAARALVLALESDNDDQVQSQLQLLTQSQENDLFNEVGKLTRELHEAMSNFNLDDSLVHLTENDMPNTRERLNYVISTTEDAANKTLGYIEQTLPLTAELNSTAEKINQSWHHFRLKEMNADEFQSFAKEIEIYLPEVKQNSEKIHANLSEMMLAQGFQDLTGQVIKLVEEVENNLVRLVQVAGQHVGNKPKDNKDVDPIKAEGPQINQGDNPNVVNDQDEVDDLLSSLGF